MRGGRSRCEGHDLSLDTRKRLHSVWISGKLGKCLYRPIHFRCQASLAMVTEKTVGLPGRLGRLTVFDSELVYTEGAQHGEHV